VKEDDKNTLKMEAIYSSEISFDFQCVTGLYIPEHNSPNYRKLRLVGVKIVPLSNGTWLPGARFWSTRHLSSGGE
jgi:hypothetical protein